MIKKTALNYALNKKHSALLVVFKQATIKVLIKKGNNKKISKRGYYIIIQINKATLS